MKLRLHGTSAQCGAATDRQRRTPGLHIIDQPGQPAGGGEGRRR
jgi:hypothetical protein